MAIKKRYEMVLLFDVKDGNPNGDPDQDNQPRVDMDTEHGLVSDVCIKRKIRDYIYLNKQADIFFRNGIIINNQLKEASEQIDPESKNKTEDTRKYICNKYYDIRTFGGVFSTGDHKAGQVRGPVQVSFARSIDEITTLSHTITRKSVTTEKEAKKQIEKDEVITGTMGNKYTIPYALYRSNIFISPAFAQDTNFSDEDLKMFVKAVINMWDIDRSSSRGTMATRALYVFEHSCPEDCEFSLGNAPACLLLESVKVKKKDGVEYPRDYSDYEVSVNDISSLKGITTFDMFKAEDYNKFFSA